MTFVSKIALSALLAGGMVLSSQATPITGSVSFNGDDTAYSGNNGTGSVQANLTLAQSIVFNHAYVSSGSTLSDGGVLPALSTGQSVTMAPYLNINPALVPSGAIWSVGGFSLTLTTLGTTASSSSGGVSSITLQGSGILSDGTLADNSSGTWIATFTSATAGTNGVTFSWNSSTPANSTTPDAGASVLLLGLGLAALGTYAQLRKQAA